MNYCVIGLAFGDEGKGTVVDFLTRRIKSKLTVRFSGGPQASHHVVLPDGRWHGFAQWGAGTFAGARTYLSPDMMIEPYAMWNEAAALKQKGIDDPWSLLTVDPYCLVITPWHWKMNRLRERARGAFKHGSCGMGIGETRQDDITVGDSVRVKDMLEMGTLWNKLTDIRARKIQEARDQLSSQLNDVALAKAIEHLEADTVADVYEAHRKIAAQMHVDRADMKEANIIFEGSQGILLDEKIGPSPYNTWSDVTPNNALKLSADMQIIGVISKLWTRHGAGPFPTEISGYRMRENHNRFNEWQGGVRYGTFDHDALKYVLSHVRVDTLAVTHLDMTGLPPLDLDALPRPISIKSHGRTFREKTLVL